MIFFFGTKPGKRTIKSLPDVPCSHCYETETLTAVSQPHYFHIFWIPLFKIRTSRYAECSHCKGVFYEEEFSAALENALGKK